MWKKRIIFIGFITFFLSFWFVYSGIFNIAFTLFALLSLFISFYIDRTFFLKEECVIFPRFSFIRYLVIILKDAFISSNYVINLMIKCKGVLPEPTVTLLHFQIKDQEMKAFIAKNHHLRAFMENSITISPGTFVIDSDDKSVLASAIDDKTTQDLEDRKFVIKMKRLLNINED
jgi:multisubunit Na+/H+ antiporter MnhE subunit